MDSSDGFGRVSIIVLLTLGIVALALWLLAAAACQTDGSGDTLTPQTSAADTDAANAPTPTPSLSPRIGAPLPPYYFVPASLDEQIFKSSVIVRATLKSATSTTKAVGSDYLAVQELRFTVHEYLKGSGASELLVVVYGDDLHTTEKKARAAAVSSLANRTTTWDGRQAVIFLRTHEQSYSPIGAALTANNKALGFTLTNSPPQSSFEYGIDTLNRVWLPAVSAALSSAQPSGSGDVTFITGGGDPWPSSITLAELKAAISKMAATLKAGEGIAGYEQCIRSKIAAERTERARGPWTHPRVQKALVSGSAAGTEVNKEWMNENEREPAYNRFWLSGLDRALFKSPNVDNDSNPANGYYRTISTTRPLPAGTYSVNWHMQHYGDFPCNFLPKNWYMVWAITVTAPTGTLHEAFFDPIYATSTGEYKADASLGVLKPAAYRKTGDTATTTIHSIAWKAQQATLTTSPGALPANHHVDFIELDGSVSLRLDVDTATTTTSGGKHTLSWRICQQPWHAGDKLMLRIAQSPANLTGATNDATCATPPPVATSTEP